MKRILIAIVALALAGTAASRAQTPAASDELVWCGLDYSKVKMIGTADFNQPADQIFPGMPIAWNELFVEEVVPKLEKTLKLPSIKTDLAGVEAANKTCTAKQIEHEDGTAEEKVNVSDIKDTDIAGMVSAYKLKSDSGLGVVFIMDRLVKLQEKGCLYIVFFDIGTRKVLHSERFVSKAVGFGFRNFWFKPVKDAAATLPKVLPAVRGRK